MSEQISLETIKKTQESLNRYIKKPPLTEKLLKKPPFRFLHDIVLSVMRETGYLEGVFNKEELVSENVKDRDSKIAFLEKLIGAVKKTTGINIKARPSKIVAGVEVNKTLELLQLLGEAIGTKTESFDQIPISNNSNTTNNTNNEKKKVLKKKIDEKKIRNEKESKDKAKKDIGSTKKKSKEKIISSERNQVNSKKFNENSSSLKTEKIVENGIDHSLMNGSLEISEEKTPNQNIIVDNVKDDKEMASNDDAERRNSIDIVQSSAKQNEINNIIEGKEINKSEISTEQENDRNKKDEKDNKKTNDESTTFRENADESNIKNEIETRIEEAEVKKEDESIKKRPHTAKLRPASARKSARYPEKVLPQEENNAEAVVFGEGGDSPALLPSFPELESIRSRPKTARRPPSARPGAPRVRDRGEVAKSINDEEIVENKTITVIEDLKDDDDKETMVTKEINHTEPVLISNNLEKNDFTDEGGLINQIIETKKNIEKDDSLQLNTQINWDSNKKAAVEKEMNNLRDGIQQLTRSANPLGKLINSLQEDLDSMQIEWKYWYNINEKLSTQILQEQKVNEESLFGLRKQLDDLDQIIENEQQSVRLLKSNILNNDLKIRTLITKTNN